MNFLIVFFCVITGVITSIWKYSYGIGNHIEQLPIIMRAIDNTFLINDFFTNANSVFGPRLYYAEFIAQLTNFANLHEVFLILTIISNILIAVVTAFFARELFGGNNLTAFAAAGAVMFMKTFWLGSSNTVYRTFLEPQLLISPLLLGAIWAGLRNRPVYVAILTGVASLIHSLVGMETGVLILGVLIIQFLLKSKSEINQVQRRGDIRNIILSGLIFGGFSLVSLIPYIDERHIDKLLFIEIVAVFRHPHHYLPSTFGLEQYLQALLFLIPTGISWYLGNKYILSLNKSKSYLGSLLVFLVFLCIGGYVFVEIVPSRIWTTAQTFRLLYIMKWLALVLISGWISYIFSPESKNENNQMRLMLVFGLISQLTMAFTFVIYLIKNQFSGNKLNLSRNQVYIVGLISGGIFIINWLILGAEYRIYAMFILSVFMIWSLYYWKLKWLAIVINIGLAALSLTFLIVGNFEKSPQFSIKDIRNEKVNIAEFMKNNTP
ncbi:MAG: hypothetical protein JEZ03_18620, partial [Bacteroidales bacterium]|nr:hypothetical protein [Bacteroidales bacterium]